MAEYVKKENPQNTGGRPEKFIDEKQFENLCKIQCTKTEICEVLGVTDKTLERWCKRTYKKGFSETFKQKRQAGFSSLRRKQFDVAMSGSIPMLIFLGKNILNQSDKITNVADTGNLNELVDALKDIQ